MMQKRVFEVELVGGLGNQLFGLAAGLYLSEKYDCGLKLSCMNLKSDSQHDSSLQDFRLASNVKEVRSLSQSRIMYRRILRKILTYHKFGTSNFSKFIGRYYSQEIGFEEGVTNLRPVKILTGYFQTFKYLELANIKFDIDAIELYSKSAWLEEKEKLIQAESPIAVHVRLGDYTKPENRETIGLLDFAYYRDAIKLAREILPDSPIWIFSNDEEGAKRLLSNIDQSGLYFLDAAGAKNDSETLVLMAKARAFVISNSTFSWWVAYLSKRNDFVISPSKWFKGRNDPTYLIPESWRKIPSVWT